MEVLEDGPYGTSYILFLVDRDNTKVKAWASKKLIRDLQRKEEYDIPYMISLGQKPYGKGKTINLYDLAFEKGEEIISLFISSSPPSSPPPKKQKWVNLNSTPVCKDLDNQNKTAVLSKRKRHALIRNTVALQIENLI